MYSFYVSIRYIAQNPRCIDSVHCKNPKCIVSIHAKNAKVGFVAPQAKIFTTVNFSIIFSLENRLQPWGKDGTSSLDWRIPRNLDDSIQGMYRFDTCIESIHGKLSKSECIDSIH